MVATLGIAASLRAGSPPKRTVLFAAFTGEEMGLLGTRWYIARPTYPIERTVANLQIEMIGRPDSLAGGAGKGWLTGYERSTMGDILRASGSPIVPDPRPSQNFFMRSDNIAFARLGIPAHTLSSFNLHRDYHRPSDEAEAADEDAEIDERHLEKRKADFPDPDALVAETEARRILADLCGGRVET